MDTSDPANIPLVIPVLPDTSRFSLSDNGPVDPCVRLERPVLEAANQESNNQV